MKILTTGKRALLGIPLLTLALAVTGCRKKDAYVTLYDKNLSAHPPGCLNLSVFPPDPAIERAAHTLYPFRSDCPYTLAISTKEGIHCNSNANAPRKTLSNFPSAYLRLELRHGMKLLYSYYRDLTAPPDADDLEEAFGRMREETGLRGAK